MSNRKASLSDRTVYDAPKPYKKAKIKQALEQSRNRNKQKGDRRQGVKRSKNANKFCCKLAKTHAKVANLRKDFIEKTTTEISRKYAHI